MAYRKDQGRYVRMGAFWCLFLLMGYGLLGGFVTFLNRNLARWVSEDAIEAWIDPFPILGRFNLSTLIGALLLAVTGFLIHRWLNRPKVADMLIDTESELRKVTWPTVPETVRGSIAVVVTVFVMFLFLTASDMVLTQALATAVGQ